MTKERHKFIAAVHLILQKNNKILLARRFNTGYGDGNYSVVAGHIDANEPARSALVREVKEEADIEIKIDDLKMIHVMHRKGNDHERIDFFMKAEKWQGKPTILEPNKCDALTWFELDELPNNMVPYVKFALENIKNNNFYSEFDW